ncbi:hypothetical protein FC756_25655, partial [Lysinibacillus mangiferihumi]
MTKFNVGDKVVPISKTVGGYGRLEESCAWNRVKSNKKPFLYVTGFEENDKFYICGVEEGRGIDFFNESDLIPYKKETKNERITTLENEVAELKLIVHELRERPQLTTVINNATQGPSTTNTVEDIIEFEGNQYCKVDRKACEGDVVIITNEAEETCEIQKNKPYKVDEHNQIAGSTHPYRYKVYRDQYNRTPETVDVYELIEGGLNPQIPIVDEMIEPLTPNQQRAAIIEKAKQFVEEKLKLLISYDFVVINNGTKLYSRQRFQEFKLTTTKCSPNDVFNEHIGKAIALGRALGLDVSEFEQAAQPTEFTKGQIVVGGSTYREPREVTKVTHDDHVYRKPIGGNDFDDSWCNAKYLTIINDTNA